jgi:hypothetical protein
MVSVSESPGQVILRNNMIVGARDTGGGAIEQDNRTYQSRRAAGLPPYPAIPERFGDSARGTEASGRMRDG